MAEKKEEEPKAEEAKEAAPAKDVEMKDAGEAGKATEDAKEAKEAKEAKDAGEASAAAAEPEEEAPKEPEGPKELEEDAPAESRSTLARGEADVSTVDATLNVLPTAGNRLLMTLTEGGFQYLLAGARTTVGLKSGRYLIEVKIVETHQQPQGGGSDVRTPQPRHLVRLGLSHAGSSLFLADGTSDSVCLDSEGFFVFGKSRKKVSQKVGRDSTMAMLVNLDKSSPNANTVSIFRDGERVCPPQAIPEQLLGKPLYPHICYKNVSVQVNLGPTPLSPLPFKCNMLASAARDDVEVSSARAPSQREVIFPIGLPEQGYFDFVDMLSEQRAGFDELSDRKLLEWASKSGLGRPKQSGGTLDKPDMKFGLPLFDDTNSMRRLIASVAPTASRSFIVPELQSNLLESERKQALQRWSEFKKTAVVVMGEPTAEYKAKVQELILAEKKNKVEAERKRKQAEEERKRLFEEKKKKAEEARKARLGKKADAEEAKDEEPEEKADEAAAPKEPADEPMIELTEEEKKLSYRKTAIADISEAALNRSYASFSLPSKEEGFDEILFTWQNEAAAAQVLKDWIFAKKLTQRVEDLQPGAEFKEAWSAWTKNVQMWRKLAADWKDPGKRKALLAKRAEAKKKEAEEKGDEAAQEEKPMEINVEDLDVFAVEDVTDIGNGEPLFANFVYEDWTLLSVRYEIHLLLHSFKKDLNDADRPSFTQKDLGFYYHKYFKKSFSLKTFAVDKFEDFMDLIKDTLGVNASNSFLSAQLGEDTPVSNFVKLAEDHRRERTRRLDAGDETAELKFPRNSPQPPSRQPPTGYSGGGGGRPGGGGGGGGRPGPSYSSRGSAYGSSNGGGGGGRPGGAYGGSAPQKRPFTPSGYGGGGGGGGGKQARTSYGGYGGGYSRR